MEGFERLPLMTHLRAAQGRLLTRRAALVAAASAAGALAAAGMAGNPAVLPNGGAHKAALKGAEDPSGFLENVTLLCEFPVRENLEASWPQGVSINADANEIYVSNQNGRELRIDVRSLSTGVRKSSRKITTEDRCWTEGMPWFYNRAGNLCFLVRPAGGTPVQSAAYAIYNYTRGTLGATVPIQGVLRADVDGDYFATTDAWTRDVKNFYLYDWASVKAGTPALLATIGAQGGPAIVGKNQGMAYVGGIFYLIQGAQNESPAFMAWDSKGEFVLSRQYGRSAFKELVNKVKPGYLVSDTYSYEAEGGCNLNGKLISVQVVNNNPAVVDNGRVLVLQHTV